MIRTLSYFFEEIQGENFLFVELFIVVERDIHSVALKFKNEFHQRHPHGTQHWLSYRLSIWDVEFNNNIGYDSRTYIFLRKYIKKMSLFMELFDLVEHDIHSAALKFKE